MNARLIQKKETVLLNITGGGEERLSTEKKTHDVEPRFISKRISANEIEELLCHILKTN